MKKRRTVSLSAFVWVTIAGLIISGCNMPGRAQPTSQVDALNTAAAQTIQAQMTSIILTSQALNQTTPTATLDADGNVVPTSTLQPTAVPSFTPTTPAPAACDQAGFVSETIPDGSDFNPGQKFTKTWTLKNTGSCTWNSNYDLVFFSGNAMTAPASQAIMTGTVAPGQSIQITLELVAPNAAGTHRGEFKLRNASGGLFGIGAKNGPFWVEIDVAGTLYDFVSNYCAAGVSWRSAAGVLPCPGASGDSEGWVRKVKEPVLETGIIENEPGLLTHPEMVNDGWIRGVFPEMILTEGVYFKTIIGCNSSEACDVKFKLNAIVDGGAEKTLATWHEVQDKAITRVKFDLSSLAGKKVQFILLVESNGSPANDEALWLMPRIEP